MPCLPCGGVDAGAHFAAAMRLGMARANTVRDCLIGTGGLADGQVRAVSYGEARNRQVRPDAVGDAGRDNRRVSLVVDYAGTSSMAAPQSIPARQPAEPDSGT